MLGSGKAEVEWMKRRSVSGDGSFMVVNIKRVIHF
jgi:hypothetical protein